MKITKFEKAFLDALATASVNPSGINICQFCAVDFAGSDAELSDYKTVHYSDSPDEYDCTGATVSFPRPWQIQAEKMITRKGVSLPAENAVKSALCDLQAHRFAPADVDVGLADAEIRLVRAIRDYGLAPESGLQGWGVSVCVPALESAYERGITRDGDFDDLDDDDVNDAMTIEQCICFAPKQSTFIPDFYFALKNCVEYYAELAGAKPLNRKTRK